MSCMEFLFGEQWKETVNNYYVHFIVGFIFAGLLGTGIGFTAAGSVLSNGSEQTAGIVIMSVSVAALLLFIYLLYASGARSVFGLTVIQYFCFGYGTIMFSIVGAILISKGDDETYIGLNLKGAGYFCLGAAAFCSAGIYLVMKCSDRCNCCSGSSEYASI